jgi:hypothetical protein
LPAPLPLDGADDWDEPALFVEDGFVLWRARQLARTLRCEERTYEVLVGAAEVPDGEDVPAAALVADVDVPAPVALPRIEESRLVALDATDERGGGAADDDDCVTVVVA